MNKQRQSGSALVIISIIISVILITGVGFVFWKNITKKPDSQTNTSQTATKPTEAKESGVINLASGDYNKYVNYESNFEFLFPKQVYEPNACQATNNIPSGDGSVTQGEVHYGAAYGPVSLTVLKTNADEYTITPDKVVVQSSPKGSNANGYIFKACNVFPTTKELVTRSKQNNYGVENIALETRSFIVKDASSSTEALSAARSIFNDPTGTVSWTKDSEDDSRQSGDFSYTPDTHLTGGFGYKLWYYPNEKKVVFFALGQSAYFQHPDGSDQYYNGVYPTFKFSTK